LNHILKNKKDLLMLENVKTLYTNQLKKYTIQTFIPKLLKSNDINSLTGIIQVLGNISNDTLVQSKDKKLLLNKCVISNKVELLKTKLYGKINLRILDKNGNTILNRLIDQFNKYAISKVLEIDPQLYTYQNNRGENSITYLYNVLNSIDKNYTKEALNKRIKTYETELQIWISSNTSFQDIQLDDNSSLIYDVILNSLYLFNESLWMLLLKAPNGWKYEDKIKLKSIIAKMKKYNIKEKLLIKSLSDDDKLILKTKYNSGSLNKKITDIIAELKKEVEELLNTNEQLEIEKKDNELVDLRQIDRLKTKNEELIKEKNNEIDNLNNTLSNLPQSDTKIDRIFDYIKDAELIKNLDIDWNEYNKLIKDNLWNYYLPLIEIANRHNHDMDEKYISYYNYGILNLDYNLLSETEMKLLSNYNNKIIDNIYSDFYDLEKYEDDEYNYINHTILNIIYLNAVNIISIEMCSAIIEYLSNKYTNNDKIKEIVRNYNNTKAIDLHTVIEQLLKNSIWDKLNLKNPEKLKIYQDQNYYKDDLNNKIKTIFNLPENNDDKIFINNLIDFYSGLCSNISYNIYNEIVNFLNDLKKHSLLFDILNLIKKK
jgi:hypothetical protein